MKIENNKGSVMLDIIAGVPIALKISQVADITWLQAFIPLIIMFIIGIIFILIGVVIQAFKPKETVVGPDKYDKVK